MEMSNEEIVRRYRQAKNKRQQVNILAQLNSCEKDKIIEVLKQEGITDKQLPRSERSDKGKKKSAEPVAEARETEIAAPAQPVVEPETSNIEEEKSKPQNNPADVNTLIIENDELRKQLALIRLENSKLESSLKKSETKNAVLQKQIDESKENDSTNSELHDIIRLKERSIELLSEENENLKNQLDEITRDYNDSMRINAKLEENIRILEADAGTEARTIKEMYLENETLKIKLEQAEKYILDKMVYS